jgi:toxin secretion/phage lysis holin
MEELIKLFQDGELPQMAQWLLLLNIIDVVTGFIKAVDTKTVSSKVMKHGALTKLVIWIVVFVSGIASSYFKTDLSSYVIGYYLVMEIISILENGSEFIPIPEKLKNILNTNKDNKTTEDNTTEDKNKSSVNDEILNYIKEKGEK